MKPRSVILLAVALAIGGGIFYLARPGHPPAGQPPLVEVTGPSFVALQAEFNRASSGVRIIVLLSPT